MSPQDKCLYIEKLRNSGEYFLMVGDGLNDVPSLAMADVAVSPSSAVDISQNSADIIFQGKKLMPVLTAYDTAKTAHKLVKQNFLWQSVIILLQFHWQLQAMLRH